VIQAEPGAIPDAFWRLLLSQGYGFKSRAFTSRWGDAEGITIDPQSGIRMGASDPRSSDAAAVGY